MTGEKAYAAFAAGNGADSFLRVPFNRLHKATQARWAAVEVALAPKPKKKVTKKKAKK